MTAFPTHGVLSVSTGVLMGDIGGACLWNETDDSKSRKLPGDTNETPDWCQYKANAIRDAQEMDK